MSRELKFRIWLKPTYEYKCEFMDRYGKKLPDLDCRFYTQDAFFDDTWINTDDYEDIIVEQYTGLKDKNGKEIYEGDIMSDHSIVRFSDDPYEVGSCGCCVPEFWGTGFIISNYNHPDQLGVIGNVHENPELLKEAK